MNQSLLRSLGLSKSDVLHKVIGTTFIVEYGIIKKIVAKGIVTVEMAVASSPDDIIITNCVLANFSSASITVNIQPKVNDKVIVLFPRKFAGNMFKASQKEVIITECGNGYSIMGGIAILLNQYQENEHENHITIDDGCIEFKANNIELTTNKDNEIEFKANNIELTTNKDNEIEVTNGKATVKIDKSGNIEIETQGKYTIKNNSTDLKDVVDSLAKELENLVTVGSPATQSTSPASKSTIATWRSTKLNQLFR